MKNQLIIVLLTGAVLMSLGKTLGDRNNNPLNIRYSKANNWGGQTGEEKGFAVFTSPVYGFRAAFKLLARYANVYGDDTIERIVTRWAPPSENETDDYINFVADKVGVMPYTTITPNLRGQVLQAMAKMETGKVYSMDVINQARKMV